MEAIHRRYVSIVKRLKLSLKCPILGQQTFFLKLQSWHFSVQTHLNIPCTTNIRITMNSNSQKLNIPST